MLSPKEILILKSRPWLPPEKLIEIWETLDLYIEANEVQANFLRECLDEVTRLKARVKFYRDCHLKIY